MTDEQNEVLDRLKSAIEKAYQAGKKDAARDASLVSVEDLGTLLHCSIGYALGRRTYMSELVPRMVRSYWQYLSPGTQGNLLRNLATDIKAHARSKTTIGDECDDRSWRSLCEWMEQNLKATP